MIDHIHPLLGPRGLAGTAGFFEGLGFRPGRVVAATAAATEIVAGVLVALGLLGPIGPALFLSVMIVAAVTVHWQHGLFAQTNGIEMPLLYGVTGVTLALTGHGAYSLDSALGLSAMWSPALTWTVLAIAALGGVANLAVRRPTPVAA